MALVVETGGIISGATSYVSRADFIAYALSFGVVVADADEADVSLVKAAQYIGSFEDQLKGERVSRPQEMSFPRSNVVIDNFYWESTEIPRNLILCQMAFAMDVESGVDLYNPPADPNQAVSKERVEGAISVEYFGKSGKLNKTSTGQALLNSLLKNSGLTLVRG